MPPPGKNANGRSLGGRKQIQSLLQSHTNIYFAQAWRGLDVLWRTRATRQEDEQLQLNLPEKSSYFSAFYKKFQRNGIAMRRRRSCNPIRRTSKYE